MVSFRLKRLFALETVRERDPSSSHAVLPNVPCAKTPHSLTRRPLTTKQAWTIPIKKTRRWRETTLFLKGETTAP